MLGLRGRKYQQTFHSPGEKNLNGYEKNMNDIADLLLSLPLILSAANERYSSRRKRSPPARYGGVSISTVEKKKNTQLASKRSI